MRILIGSFILLVDGLYPVSQVHGTLKPSFGSLLLFQVTESQHAQGDRWLPNPSSVQIYTTMNVTNVDSCCLSTNGKLSVPLTFISIYIRPMRRHVETWSS
jgi:hypothetical protein